MGIHEQMLGGAAPCYVVNVLQCLGKVGSQRTESASCGVAIEASYRVEWFRITCRMNLMLEKLDDFKRGSTSR